jgi:hypothetical protein
MRAPSAVTVCSLCAARAPDAVRSVHPSGSGVLSSVPVAIWGRLPFGGHRFDRDHQAGP